MDREVLERRVLKLPSTTCVALPADVADETAAVFFAAVVAELLEPPQPARAAEAMSAAAPEATILGCRRLLMKSALSRSPSRRPLTSR